MTAWKEYRNLGALAAAYAELGDFRKAVGWQHRALDLALPADKKEFQDRLALYQAGKPYREAPVRK